MSRDLSLTLSMHNTQTTDKTRYYKDSGRRVWGVLVSSACPHVSGPGAGSRGGVVPNPRHCTKILPGGRGWSGGGTSSDQGPPIWSVRPVTLEGWMLGRRVTERRGWGGSGLASLPPCEWPGSRQPGGSRPQPSALYENTPGRPRVERRPGLLDSGTSQPAD